MVVYVLVVTDYLCVSVCMHRGKCWRVSSVRAVTLTDKSWVTSLRGGVLSSLSSSFFLHCFSPPPPPFTPPSSLERFHYPLKGLNGVCRAEYKAGKERTGKRLRET